MRCGVNRCRHKCLREQLVIARPFLCKFPCPSKPVFLHVFRFLYYEYVHDVCYVKQDKDDSFNPSDSVTITDKYGYKQDEHGDDNCNELGEKISNDSNGR